MGTVAVTNRGEKTDYLKVRGRMKLDGYDYEGAGDRDRTARNANRGSNRNAGYCAIGG